ncbi:hypothetical protein A7K94_0206195 [Modestobacter sp. VKM Ac-2676]|nr:hypothetical protein A7K94_0206195 [Modestobacter sp. VKM Ac-2676]
MTLGLGASLLVGCSGGNEPAASSANGGADERAASIDEVTFLNIIPIESLYYLLEMVATCEGFFEEQRLDVSFEATQGSAPALNTVIADGALLTKTGDIEMITAMAAQDAPLVNVGTVIDDGVIRFISSEQEPLEQPEDFRGKVIGLPALGGGAEAQLNLMLSANGIQPEEVERQVTGLAPGVYDLVASGRIDGYAVALDTAVILQSQQPDAVAMDPSEFIAAGVHAYVTSEDQLADPERADQLARYLQAVGDALAFVAEDEGNDFAETIACLSDEFDAPAMADPDVAQDLLGIYLDASTADGLDAVVRTDPEQWNQAYEAMVEAGLVPGGSNPEEWITDEVAPTVEG